MADLSCEQANGQEPSHVRDNKLTLFHRYALTAYGTEGVCKAIELINDEVQTTLRLLGVTSLEQLTEYYVNTSVLEKELPQRIDLHERSKL